MTTSWKTTVIGVLAGILTYLQGLGPNLPTDLKGWGVALLAALLAGLGIAAKDMNISNAANPQPPGPAPTK